MCIHIMNTCCFRRCILFFEADHGCPLVRVQDARYWLELGICLPLSHSMNYELSNIEIFV